MEKALTCSEVMRAPMFDGHAVLNERPAKAQGAAGEEKAPVEDFKATASGNKRGPSSTPTANLPLPLQGKSTKKVDQRSTPTWIPNASASLVQPASLPSSQESGVTGSDISQWIGQTQRSFASRLLHKPAGSGEASATSSSSSGSSRWRTRTCPATPPHNAAPALGGMHHESSITPPLTPPVAAAVAAVAAAAQTLPSSHFSMPTMQEQQLLPSARSCDTPAHLPPAALGVAAGEAAAVATAAPPAPRQAPTARQRNPPKRAQARQGGSPAAAGGAGAARAQIALLSSSSEGDKVSAAPAVPARRKATSRVHASVAAAAMVAVSAAAARDEDAAVAPSCRGGKRGNGQGRIPSLTRSGAIKGPWTKEEDAIIVALYESGVRKWADIAEQIPGRVGKQCRERWFNHLDPEVKKTVWLPEEDRILVTAQHAFGNSWTKIAKLLPGRSENAVKNRWNSAARRKAKAEADASFPVSILNQAAFGSDFDAKARWLASDVRVPTEDATAAVLAAVAAVEAREAEEWKAKEPYATLSPEERALVPKRQASHRKLSRGRKKSSAAPASLLRRCGAVRSSSPRQKGVSAARRRPADAGVDCDSANAAAWACGGLLPPPLLRPASAPQMPIQPAIVGGRYDAPGYQREAPVAPVASGGAVSSNKPLQNAGELAKARQLHSSRGQLQQQEEQVMGAEETVVGSYGAVFGESCGGMAMVDPAGVLGMEMSGGLGAGAASHFHHGAMAMPMGIAVPMQMASFGFLDISRDSATVPRCLTSPPLGEVGMSSPRPHGDYFLHGPLVAGGDRAVAPAPALGLCRGDADSSELFCSSVAQKSAEDDDPFATSLSMEFSLLAAGMLGGTGGSGCVELTPGDMPVALNQLDMGALGNSIDGGVDPFYYDRVSATGDAGTGS